MYFLGPAIPGAITQSVFNGPTISISWAITGDLEYLSGIINEMLFPQRYNIVLSNTMLNDSISF
jgi:hypothetical protein